MKQQAGVPEARRQDGKLIGIVVVWSYLNLGSVYIRMNVMLLWTKY